MKIQRKSENVSYLPSFVHSFFLSPISLPLSLFFFSFLSLFLFLFLVVFLSLSIYILPSFVCSFLPPLSLSLSLSFLPSYLPYFIPSFFFLSFSFLFYPSLYFSLPILLLLLLLLLYYYYYYYYLSQVERGDRILRNREPVYKRILKMRKKKIKYNRRLKNGANPSAVCGTEIFVQNLNKIPASTSCLLSSGVAAQFKCGSPEQRLFTSYSAYFICFENKILIW